MLSGNAAAESTREPGEYLEVTDDNTEDPLGHDRIHANTVFDVFSWITRDDVPFLRPVRFISQDMRERLPAIYLAALETKVRMTILYQAWRRLLTNLLGYSKR